MELIDVVLVLRHLDLEAGKESRLELFTWRVLVWTGLRAEFPRTRTCTDLTFLLLSQIEPSAPLSVGSWALITGSIYTWPSLSFP